MSEVINEWDVTEYDLEVIKQIELSHRPDKPGKYKLVREDL